MLKNLGKNKELIYAVVINILFIVVYNLMFYPRFHSDLDILMQSAIYGISGISSSYIIYSNILIGKLLTVLQGIIPGVAWYMIFHLFLSFIAISVIAYITMKRNNGGMGRLFSIIIIAFLGYECYIEPNYMKTAVVLTVSAAYLFLYAYEMKRRVNLIAVLIMSVISSMICFSAFIFSALISFVIVFVECIKQKCNKKWKVAIITTVLSICVLTLGLYVFDNATYSLNGRDKVSFYRGTIERILGYGASPYSIELMEDLETADINHYALAQGVVTFAEEEQFEVLEKFASNNSSLTFETIIQFFREVPISLFQTGLLYYLIVFSVIYCIGTGKKSEVIKLTIVLLIEYLIFYVFNAWQYEWISFIIMLPLSLILMIEIREISTEEIVNYSVYAIVLAIILYSNFVGTMVTSIKEDKTSTLFSELSTDVIYMVDMVEYLRLHSVYQVYDIEGIPSNVYLINTGYTLMDEFVNCVNLTPPEDDEEKYVWLYNPLGFSLEDIFM